MKSLGNKFIQTRTGPHIQIADPAAADDLLDLALEAANHKQRLLFFCSCQWPRCDGEIACHRTTVADLVLKAAQQRGEVVEIVEWPGGEPGTINLDVEPRILAALKRGRVSIPLDENPNLGQLAGVPWCSIATLHAGHETLHRIVGPAIRQPDQWVLPVLEADLEAEDHLTAYEEAAARLRRGLGVEAASV